MTRFHQCWSVNLFETDSIRADKGLRLSYIRRNVCSRFEVSLIKLYVAVAERHPDRARVHPMKRAVAIHPFRRSVVILVGLAVFGETVCMVFAISHFEVSVGLLRVRPLRNLIQTANGKSGCCTPS